MEEKEKKKNKYLWLIFLLLIIIVIFAWILKTPKPKTKSASSTDNNLSYVSCFAKPSDNPSFPKTWEGWLYSAPISERSGDQGTKDTNIRTFSIKNLSEKTGDSIYFRLQRTGFAQKEYVTGVKTVLEICNDENMTPVYYSVANKNIPQSGEKISATILHLHNNPKIFKPGKYRIDALMNIDGNWVLTGRINGVKLTD